MDNISIKPLFGNYPLQHFPYINLYTIEVAERVRKDNGYGKETPNLFTRICVWGKGDVYFVFYGDTDVADDMLKGKYPNYQNVKHIETKLSAALVKAYAGAMPKAEAETYLQQQETKNV